LSILVDKLTEYGMSDYYPYHMPGHKREPIKGFPQEILSVDITEVEGFDNLHQAEGILLDAQKRAATAYGAEESYYLINGSSCGILGAISAAVPFGGHLLIARNCHRSVYHGAYLRRLKLSYLYPKVDAEFGICEAITPDQIQQSLKADPSIQAVLIVSPTYEGRIADIAAIARIVHQEGIPLIVDEAHGAHLGFEEHFAVNSSRLGADLVINSTHKTLPAMTQTALLHCNGSLIDRDILRRYLRIYQSSSPSYVLMASIDQAIQIAREEPERFCSFYNNWINMLEKLNKLNNIKVLPGMDTPPNVHDIGKLILSVKHTNVSGKQLVDILREKYHLELEMACETYALAMFTVADTKEGYERMIQALSEVDGQLQSDFCGNAAEEPLLVLEQKLPFCQAWNYQKKWIPLEEAAGCVVGGFLHLYPPGTPIAVPGEILDSAVVQKIQNCLLAGLEVSGLMVTEKENLVPVLI